VPELGEQHLEVAGGAAVLVDPHSAASIAAGLRAALADTDGLRERGLRRASELTWAAAAAATVDAYREAVEMHGEQGGAR